MFMVYGRGGLLAASPRVSSEFRMRWGKAKQEQQPGDLGVLSIGLDN